MRPDPLASMVMFPGVQQSFWFFFLFLGGGHSIFLNLFFFSINYFSRDKGVIKKTG